MTTIREIIGRVETDPRGCHRPASANVWIAKGYSVAELEPDRFLARCDGHDPVP